MRKDKGLSGELDRIPMLTWILFLKFLDDHEQIRDAEVRSKSGKFHQLIEPPYRWRDWASKNDGITGDELIAFINQDEAVRPDGIRGLGLFAYLRQLSGLDGKNRHDVIATIFKNVSNRMINGYLLRDAINKIDEIQFNSTEEIQTLAFLYESLLKEMRDSAGDSGEFYTPRPIIKFMTQVINPQLGETILDPSADTGGFLVEAFEHIKLQCKTAEDFELLQKATLFGFEAKPLTYLLCQMNMLLHGVKTPEIDPGNALRFPLKEISDKDRVDVILTNPPFGGDEAQGILSNFPEDKQTNKTTLLFLQLIMKKLRRSAANKCGGRCGLVVPSGTLFGDGVCARIKKELLEDFNLHTIIRLPNGLFAPYTTINTNLLFFNHGGPTKEIWYYELPPPEGRKQYTKTYPLQFDAFQPCLDWWNNRVINQYAWKVLASEIIKNDEDGNLISINLDIKNPNNIKPLENKSPDEIVKNILDNEKNFFEIIKQIQNILTNEDDLKPDINKSIDN